MAPWWLHSQTDKEHKTDPSASADGSTSVAPKTEKATSSNQAGSEKPDLDSADPRRRVSAQPSVGGSDSQTGARPEEPPRRRRRGRKGKSKQNGLKPGTEAIGEPTVGKSQAGAPPKAAIPPATALESKNPKSKMSEAKVPGPKAPESKVPEAKEPESNGPELKVLEAKAQRATAQEPTVRESAAQETVAQESRVDQPSAQRPKARKETVRNKPNAERSKKAKNGNSRQGVITAADIIPDFEEPTPELEDEVESRLHHPESVGSLGNGVIFLPERGPATDERKIAMFVDFENIALGVRDSEIKTFDIGLFMERLLEKGKIIVKRAYADWERYSEFKRPLHEAAIELIDIPQKYYSGKNSADIKMVVDAMDLCYSKEHLDTFVLVSGDSDFSPLVSKLKENDKYVMGLGAKNASSHLLIDNCDEFIFYEDVWRDSQKAPRLDHLPKKEADCFLLMSEAILALLRENKDVLWGSMIKQTMKRKRPSFNEGYYGYSTFSELLQDAERKKIIRLRRDRRSGGFVVLGFASPKGY